MTTDDGLKAQFQKNDLTIDLADGTKLTIKPTAVNDQGDATIDSVAVTKGNQAELFNDVSDGQGIQSSGIMQDGAAGLDNANADGTVLRAGDSLDDLYTTDSQGNIVAQLPKDNGSGGQTDLDGLGGASEYTAPGNSGVDSSSTSLSDLSQLTSLVQNSGLDQADETKMLNMIISLLQQQAQAGNGPATLG